MSDRRLGLALLVGTVVSLVFLWLTGVPLGVPGEWTWLRVPVDGRVFDLLFGWLMAAVVGAGYLGLVWLGASRLAVCSRVETAGWLAGLVVAGFAWLSVVQESPVDEYRMQKAAWVLYYPASEGYFYKARYEMDDASRFLAGYEELMAQGDVLHVGTHPPGLFLLHRGLIRLCEASPGLVRLLLATQPASVADGFSTIEEHTRFTPRALRESDRAAIWLAALLTQLAVVLTVVPLYLLVRRFHSRPASWLAAAFWPLIPAVAVFLPKSDALYPLLGMAFLWLWLTGWERRSPLLCLSAGLLFWLGMFLTLALLPVGLLAALLALWNLHRVESQDSTANRPIRSRAPNPLRLFAAPSKEDVAASPDVSSFRASLRDVAVAVACASVGFLLPVFVLWVGWDINLFNVWAWNYHNHAGFYAEYPRTYWKWLLVNPLELALAAGLPLMILGVASYRTVMAETESWTERRLGPYWGCLIVWGLLWLSGKNMGEAARLWLLILPWLPWLSAARIEPLASRSPNAPLFALAMQLVVCIATVTRVHGFHYG